MKTREILRKSKSELIPTKWKLEIDKILTQELLNANRDYAKRNPRLSKLVKVAASNLPQQFYNDLCNRWNWHNKFYENLLEPALDLLLTDNNFSLSLLQIGKIIDSYKTMILVDQATLVMSAAIKPHVEFWTSDEKTSILSEEEKFMLLTPPIESFWIQYHIDHLEYFLAEKKNKNIEKTKKYLLKKYHANDNLIFKGRLIKFTDYKKISQVKLEREIKKLKISDSYKTNHFYFTLERPKLKAIKDTLIYDNLEEYNMFTGLVGISGFILRKSILEHLHKTKIMPNKSNIYEFKDSIVLRGLKKMLNYRKDVSFKDVSHYRQTGLTCGASCLMMAMHYYGKSKLDKPTEKKLHLRTKATDTEGNHFSGLAREAAKTGLETILVHSESNMFKNEKFVPDELFKKLMIEYKKMLKEAKAYKTKVQNGVNIDFDLIKKYLENDYLVIVAGHINETLHAVLAIGYNTEGLIISDPLKTKKEVIRPFYANAFMNTPIGEWILAIRKDHSNLKKLSKALPEYNNQANIFLSIKKSKGGEKQ